MADRARASPTAPRGRRPGEEVLDGHRRPLDLGRLGTRPSGGPSSMPTNGTMNRCRRDGRQVVELADHLHPRGVEADLLVRLAQGGGDRARSPGSSPPPGKLTSPPVRRKSHGPAGSQHAGLARRRSKTGDEHAGQARRAGPVLRRPATASGDGGRRTRHGSGRADEVGALGVASHGRRRAAGAPPRRSRDDLVAAAATPRSVGGLGDRPAPPAARGGHRS